MPAKPRSLWWHAEASRRFASGSGESLRDIALVLRSRAPNGKKAPSKSTIARFLAPPTENAPAAPSAPTAPALPSEVLDPDRTPYSPEDLIRDTAASLRQQRALFRVLMDQNEHARAQQAAKLVGYYTGVLQKLQKADEDDGDAVRVRASDLTAARERTRTKVLDLITRLAQERPA